MPPLVFERVSHQDRVLAFRTGREQGHWAPHQLLDTANVLDGLRRKFRPGAGPCCCSLPACHRLVDWHDSSLSMLARRQIVDIPTIQAIPDTDPNLRETIEDVELGESQTVDSAGSDGLADQDGIEPTAAPRASRDGAEFTTSFADEPTNVVALLGGKRALPYTRRIGLADSQYVADCRRPQPGAGRRLRRHRVGRGYERIGAVVDIEQGALG